MTNRLATRAVVCALLCAATACGIAGRPPRPGLIIPVEDVRAEVYRGAPRISWRGAPLPDTRAFEIQRRMEGYDGEQFKLIATIDSHGEGPYAFVDEPLRPGEVYTYRVRAVPRAGRGHIPFTGGAVSLAWEVTPGEPTQVVAESVAGGVRLRWNSVEGADGYRVMRDTGAGWVSAHVGTLRETFLVDMAPSATEKVAYQVLAIRILPGSRVLEGPPAAPVIVSPGERAPPPPPENVSALWSEGGVALSWTTPSGEGPELRYRVYRRHGSRGKFERLTPDPISKPTFFDEDVKKEPPPEYRVSAVSVTQKEGKPSEAVTPR